MKIFAIIPAAGKGSRSGYSIPKQYIKFKGKELIAYTLELFQNNKNIDEIIVSFRLQLLIVRKNMAPGSKIIKAENSVYNALKQLKTEKDDLIVVHDAARPMLPPEILNDAIALARLKGNALVCIKAGDTLIQGNDAVKKYIDRKDVYHVQTPQIFKYIDLFRAMEKAYKRNFYGTDESMLVKKLGKKIYIAEGSPLNFKITTKSDLRLVSMIIDKL
jgi:2-C-methyl-D-erythritol 4-phosphate cytidylyltransferase